MSWERRWHPLREEWVTITGHRNTRPWLGSKAEPRSAVSSSYVDDCYLCPGNRRISGQVNDDYESVFVFDNDHPAFSMDAPDRMSTAPGIYHNAPARGICRVVCYSPQHDLTLAEMGVQEIAGLLRCWARQTRELVALEAIRNVLIFENKGDIVGVSNPHPHCQIYAADFVFKTIESEQRVMREHWRRRGIGLLSEIIGTEIGDGRRLVACNDRALAFVPYFARFPYEVYVASVKSHAYLFELDDDEIAGLADVLSNALVRLDNLWRMSFPYILVVHQAPCGGAEDQGYHCHIQIHPPLRQPGLQKFLAGVETGGGHFLNDKSPEDAAAELQQTSSVHFKADRAGPGDL